MIFVVGSSLAMITMAGEEPTTKIMCTLTYLTDKNVEQLRILNRVVCPVTYTEKFYDSLLAKGNSDWTQLAFHNDVMVGAICTRKDLEDANKVYIMTVGVLAPYRDNLIGSKLLWKIIEKCNEEAEVKQIYLHVQQGNDDAVNFYAKFGFEVGDEVKDYYKRIDPPHAIILYKNIK